MGIHDSHDSRDFQQRLARLEGLIQAIGRFSSADAQATTKELLKALMELHGMSLERLLDVAFESGLRGQELIDALGRDEVVSHLLLLHGLHPLDLETRVLQALEKVRPYMQSHGGNVELLEITSDGVVRLRLEGSCHSCPSSRVTLKYAVEDALHAVAPDITGVEAEGAVAAPTGLPAGFPVPGAGLSGGANQGLPGGFIPLAQVGGMGSLGGVASPSHETRENGHDWVTVDGLVTLRDGSLRTLNVSGQPVLFCRLGDTFYAYGHTCPLCGQLLGQARLVANELVCGQCGHRYDLMRAGRDMDEPARFLAPFPLLAEGNQVKIALPVQAL